MLFKMKKVLHLIFIFFLCFRDISGEAALPVTSSRNTDEYPLPVFREDALHAVLVDLVSLELTVVVIQ